VIYDHRGRPGNKEVTIADSGRMYTILNEQYLKLELFRGYNYNEGGSQDMSHNTNEDTYSKSKFKRTEVVFDLSSFGLIRTDKKWFASNRIMRNLSELSTDMDSMRLEVTSQELGLFNVQSGFFSYHFKKDPLPMPLELRKFSRLKDSLSIAKTRDTSIHPPPSLSSNARTYQPPQIKVP